jgi:hypothetical protein
MKLLALSICLCLCLSCQKKYSKEVMKSLELAGDNRGELEKLLVHYSKNQVDSLKFKAALFLISNMQFYEADYHSYYKEKTFDKLSKIGLSDYGDVGFQKRHLDALKILSNIRVNIEEDGDLRNDIENLSYKFLIENIDLAFEAWYKIPVIYRANFTEFCHYILPYRNNNEPVYKGDRQKLYQQYNWVYDSLNTGMQLKDIVTKVVKEFHFYYASPFNEYHKPLSINQIDKAKMGQCSDGVNYFVQVFRALGIQAMNDYVPHWGNHSTKGHEWITIKFGKEEFTSDVVLFEDSENPNLFVIYREDSTPKVFRRSFAKNLIEHEDEDVTQKYCDTFSPTIPILFDSKKDIQAKICVFDTNTGWSPVDDVQWINEKLIRCSKIGKNVVFMVGFFDERGFNPLNYPFTHNPKKNTVMYFQPSNSTLDSVQLLRKTILFSKRDPHKIKMIEDLNGSYFEGSNDMLFKKADRLHTIQNLHSPQLQRVAISNRKMYKYVRFKPGKNNGYVAEVSFLDLKENAITGKVIKSNKEFSDELKDGYSWTYFGGKNSFIGLSFPNPEIVSAIEFQSRNDGNHILKGDNYELFYWDKDWISLGTKQAIDTVLYYNKVPKNALLLLKDITKGSEEHVFTIDQHKKQHWIGSHIR